MGGGFIRVAGADDGLVVVTQTGTPIYSQPIDLRTIRPGGANGVTVAGILASIVEVINE